jgi:ubiquinone/menaquinone biosynthesis C-methylase UbiE
MDDYEESELYDQMDHDVVNRQFVDDLLAVGIQGDRVLDLGTGTARIPILLCKSVEDCQVMACDAAVTMLDIGRLNVAVAGLEHRIRLFHCDAKRIECPDNSFDCVISNSLVHHVPSPSYVLSEIVRVLRSGGRLFVRDLFRPQDQRALEELVARYSANEPPQSQQLLRQSLQAALTVQEVQEIVCSLGLPADSVYASSDRHWTWSCIKP